MRLTRSGFHVLILSALGLTSLRADPCVIEFTTEPAMDRIIPDGEMAKLVFSVKDKGGKPVSRARLHITMDAPPSHPLFSTDFPIVEGSHLMDVEVDAPDGVLSIDYVMPIRGAYNLEVTAVPVAGHTPFEATTAKTCLELNQAPSEVRNLCLLIAILAVYGGVSGFILGRSHRSVHAGAS